jgi:NAD(P)H-hydrate epimerase
MRTLNRDQIRAVERRAIEHYGVPEIVLMENAGRGSAELLLGLGVRGLVIVCCGSGNNGGDGLVIARHLDNRGVSVRVLQFGEPTTLAAQTNYQIICRSGLPLDGIDMRTPIKEKLPPLLEGAGWIVDALFGTGLRGALRPPFDEIVLAINRQNVPVLAVDVPSGLDCDTGKPFGPCVRADHTATFMTSKVGFVGAEAAKWLGQVHVLEIGVPRHCFDDVNG